MKSTPTRHRNLARAPLVAWEYNDSIQNLPYALRLDAILVDALSAPAVFLLMLAAKGAGKLVRKLLSLQQMRELKPAKSLRGAPCARDITDVWQITPRTLIDRLRIGSRLLDLEPTVDHSFVWQENRNTGKREIIARHAGIKGWLRIHCPTVSYSTAMGYKKLAARLKTLCGVTANIPLEWLFPNAKICPENQGNMAREKMVKNGRRILASLLVEGKSLRGLGRLVEKRMRIVRLPGKKAINSLILQQNAGKRVGKKNPAGIPWEKQRKKQAERLAASIHAHGTAIMEALRRTKFDKTGKRLIRRMDRLLWR